ncbi:hypothetical protein J3F81_000979 [Coemansia sp. RSA 371]|nr:hypothetical protein J3F81_000979 [Coemansia sp. RSA 371]
MKSHHNPASAAAAHPVGGPMAYTPTMPQHPQLPQHPQHSQSLQRPYAYPEVVPPPLMSAPTAPTLPYGQQWPVPTMPPSANTFWGQVPEVSPKAFHSTPYPTLQQQYIPLPPPPPPVAMPVNTFVPGSQPGYYRMPKHSRPPRASSIGHSRPPNAPSAFYPQSAPISPTNRYDTYMNPAQPLKYHQADMYPVPSQNLQPMSVPAPQPQSAYATGQPMPSFPIATAPQVTLPSRPSSGGHTPVQKKHGWAKSPPNSSNGAHDMASRLQIAYLRNMDRVCERSNFNTLFHCLKPVDLISKSSAHMTNNREHHRGNLYPLYKVNEDWIAPNVGLPLKNRIGYRCLLYVVDGTLLYDNGISGEKLLSKGTIHMFTSSLDISIYARNPSKTHRAHIVRMWIETNDIGPTGNTSTTTTSDTIVSGRHTDRRQQPNPALTHPGFHGLIRHVADSDKQNCLLILAQPENYLPSFGMTERIYGPLIVQPKPMPKDSLANIRSGAASPLESSYCVSQSMLFTRPEYFTPEPVDDESTIDDKEWEVTDPQLTSRVCVDPLKVEEDIFVSVCQLETGAKVVYEPYDSHDKSRAHEHQRNKPSRGSHRRVWIQTIMADLNTESSVNGGRLVINGDMVNRMRPGDSAYVRRVELHESLVIENCGRVPIDFVLVETPY